MPTKKRSLIYQAYAEAISCGFGRGDDGLDEWQRESIKKRGIIKYEIWFTDSYLINK